MSQQVISDAQQVSERVRRAEQEALQQMVAHYRRHGYESDVNERISSRVHGIQAISSIAIAELENDTTAPRVWSELWRFVGIVVDDIAVDAEILARAGIIAARRE